MERHISREQAEAELEEIVNGFDSMKEFWKNDTWEENFLSDYRALRAQLKDGDGLRMEFGRGPEKDGSYGFNIVLYPKDRGRRIISNTIGSATAYAKDGGGSSVLYND